MFRRCCVLLLVVSTLPVFVHAQSGLSDRCGDSSLPFADIEVKQPIDSSCGPEGNPTASANSKLQNRVKNDFCAEAGGSAPEPFTVQMLVDLQSKTKVPSGYKQEPSDRTTLQQLGESKVIRLKAYLFEAHHADLGGGESVNCNGGAEADNDVHIALVSDPGAQECQSVTAEISPHFRPNSWNEIGHDEKYDSATKQYTPNPAIDSRLKGQPFRITGQLFFDASHKVCPCTTHCTPVRASLWEIHPVYAIEVCRVGSSCDENNDSDWLAFDKWWKGQVPVKPPRGPHKHPHHEAPPS